MLFEVVSWRSDERVQLALVSRGRKWITCCIIDTPVCLTHEPMDEARYMIPTKYGVADTARKFLRSGRHLGITAGAKHFLKQAAGEI